MLIYALLFILISWTGLLSLFQSTDPFQSLLFSSGAATTIAGGLRELLTTWTFAVFIVATIFRIPLIFEPGNILERSFFVALRGSALVLLVHMLMGVLIHLLLVMANQDSLLSILRSSGSDYASFPHYFWGVSVTGMLMYAGDGLRVFTYLLGLYLGLQTAFQDPEVRKQLSEVS